MKKLLPLLSVLFLISVGSGQEVEWIQTYGGDYYDEGRDFQITNDNGYIITGRYGLSSFQDLPLIKTDSIGNQEWIQIYSSSDGSDYDSDVELGYSVQQTSDGGYIVVGTLYEYEEGYNDLYLIKTNSNGESEWIKEINGSNSENESDDYGNDYGRSVRETFDGGYIVTGYTCQDSDCNIWLIKTNEYGDVEWIKEFEGLEDDWENGHELEITSDNGYIIIGTKMYQDTNGSFTESDIWLIKTNQFGDLEWDKTFSQGSDINSQGYSVKETFDGGFIITGNVYSTNDQERDMILIKTDIDGNEEWNRTFGGLYNDYGNSVIQNSNNGFTVSGYTDLMGDGIKNLWVVNTDELGNELWSHTIGEHEGCWGCSSVKQRTDGNFIILGNMNDDIVLLKLDPPSIGDINMDGEIDDIDIILGVNIILGIIEPSNGQIELLDYNQDNENNIFDILSIVDHTLDL